MKQLTATEIKKLKEFGIELEQKQFDQATELGTLTGGLKLSVFPETERPFVLTDGDMNYTSVTLKSLLAFYETLDYIKIENVALKAEEEYSSNQEELVCELQEKIENLGFEIRDLKSGSEKISNRLSQLQQEYNKVVNELASQKPLNWVQRLFNWF